MLTPLSHFLLFRRTATHPALGVLPRPYLIMMTQRRDAARVNRFDLRNRLFLRGKPSWFSVSFSTISCSLINQQANPPHWNQYNTLPVLFSSLAARDSLTVLILLRHACGAAAARQRLCHALPHLHNNAGNLCFAHNHIIGHSPIISASELLTPNARKQKPGNSDLTNNCLGFNTQVWQVTSTTAFATVKDLETCSFKFDSP